MRVFTPEHRETQMSALDVVQLQLSLPPLLCVRRLAHMTSVYFLKMCEEPLSLQKNQNGHDMCHSPPDVCCAAQHVKPSVYNNTTHCRQRDTPFSLCSASFYVIYLFLITNWLSWLGWLINTKSLYWCLCFSPVAMQGGQIIREKKHHKEDRSKHCARYDVTVHLKWRDT